MRFIVIPNFSETVQKYQVDYAKRLKKKGLRGAARDWIRSVRSYNPKAKRSKR